MCNRCADRLPLELLRPAPLTWISHRALQVIMTLPERSPLLPGKSKEGLSWTPAGQSSGPGLLRDPSRRSLGDMAEPRPQGKPGLLRVSPGFMRDTLV